MSTATPTDDGSTATFARRLATPLKILATFHLVALAWVFFRAPTLPAALHYLRGLFVGPDRAAASGPLQVVYLRDVVTVGAAALALLLLVDLPQYLSRDATRLLRWPVVLKGLVLGLLLTWILAVQGEPGGAFIYFQF